jgi:hypothetical protein
MPQSVTFSIGAKVDKGPELKSESKGDIATYGALVEEVVCKTNTSTPFLLPPFEKAKIDFILVTSDKYVTDKDCPPLPGEKARKKEYIEYWFSEKKTKKELKRPDFLSDLNLPDNIDTITFYNPLPIDVKVSVLVVQKYEPNNT